jgi:hypothetical protein
VGIVEPLLDQADGQVCDVDPDPVPLELLGRCDGRSAAAKRIEDEIAFVRAGQDDPFEQSFRLLRGIAETFWTTPTDQPDISPSLASRSQSPTRKYSPRPTNTSSNGGRSAWLAHVRPKARKARTKASTGGSISTKATP